MYSPNISWYLRFVSVKGFSRGSGASPPVLSASFFDLEPEDRPRRVRDRFARRDVSLDESVGEPEAEAVVEVEGVGEVAVGEGADLRSARRTFSRIVILGFAVRNSRCMRGRIVEGACSSRDYMSWTRCVVVVALAFLSVRVRRCPVLLLVTDHCSARSSCRFRNSETGKSFPPAAPLPSLYSAPRLAKRFAKKKILSNLLPRGG